LLLFNDLRYRCTLVSFFAFVLLRLDGQDVRDLPLLERNRRLAASASDHTVCTTCPTLSVARPICC
jgi:ATP-dependent DNA ligase